MTKTTKKKKEFRSGSERRSSAILIAEGIKHEYEPHFIQYEVSLVRRYLPDFILKPSGIILEVKGWFKPADRSKHLQIRHVHPNLDIRFVFDNPNARISKVSKTTYAQWCDKHDFKYCKGPAIPVEWIEENHDNNNKARRIASRRLKKSSDRLKKRNST